MKKITLLSLVALTATAVVGSTQASAKSMTTEGEGGNQKSTQTTVKIEDGGKDTDPNVTEEHLNLQGVPVSYDFTSKLSTSGDYALTADLAESTTDVNTNKVLVFNDNMNQEWSVTASVSDDQLTQDNKTYAVTEFIVNTEEQGSVNLLDQGKSPIIAKSAAVKSIDNNTGLIKTTVKSVGIKFKDVEQNLKAGSSLQGQIMYNLYSTEAAK